MGQCSFSHRLAFEKHGEHSITLMSEIITLSNFRANSECKTHTGRTTAGNSLDQFFIQYTFCGSIIGQGSIGIVRQALYRPTNQQRAVKIVCRSKYCKKIHKICLQEVKILSRLDHPNIVKLFEYIEDNQDFYMATELAQGKNLFDYISEIGPLPEKRAIIVMRQILSAMSYLHSQNIVHRDIKLENIIFDGKLIKLVDFGTAKELTCDHKMSSLRGTFHYMAPEVILRSYSIECDVWAAGVMLLALLTGHLPFKGSSHSEVMCSILSTKLDFNSHIFQKVSNNAKDLLSAMLNTNPSRRITAREVLSHKWIAGSGLPNPELTRFGYLGRVSFSDPLQKIAYRLIVILSEGNGEKMNMIDLFDCLDADHNGQLNERKLNSLHRGNKIAKKADNLKDQPAQSDDHCSKFMTFTDFLSNFSNPKQFVNQDSVDLIFNYLDPDHHRILRPRDIIHRAAPFFTNSQDLSELENDLIEQWPDAITYEGFKSAVLALRK